MKGRELLLFIVQDLLRLRCVETRLRSSPSPLDHPGGACGLESSLTPNSRAVYRKRTHTGVAIRGLAQHPLLRHAVSTDEPVGVRRPDSASTRKLTIVSDFCFAATRNRAVGSSEKCAEIFRRSGPAAPATAGHSSDRSRTPRSCRRPIRRVQEPAGPRDVHVRRWWRGCDRYARHSAADAFEFPIDQRHEVVHRLGALTQRS